MSRLTTAAVMVAVVALPAALLYGYVQELDAKRYDVHVIPRPPGFRVARLSEDDVVKALRAKLERDAADDRFGGAVAIAHRGKVIFSGAYGPANREKRIANTTDTRFRIGSMNKMFTAVAILQLAQEGKLAVTDTVGTHIRDYPNEEVRSKVTLHHLLTHTGGTGDIFGPEYFAKRLATRTLDDYVTLYGSRALTFEPGTRFSYSNYGFLLLGVIVERVSKMSYYDYVRERVFKPAGMLATGSEPEDEDVPNRAVAYTKRTGTWQSDSSLPYRGTSAGGGYSTVGDLLKFAEALQAHTLLNAHYTELLTTGKVEVGMRPSWKYAYGFLDRLDSGVRSIGHGGGAPGQNGELIIYMEAGYVIAALANMDPPAATRAAEFAGNRLPK